MKRLAVIYALCLALIAAPLPALSGAGHPVHIGYLGLATDAGIFIALEKGYFREQGIEVSLERFATGAEQMVLLGSGRLEIASGSPSPAFFNAILHGLPIVAVADKGSARKGFSAAAVVIRKALVDSGRFRSLKDLKGLVLASPDRTNIAQFEYYEVLKKAGLTLQDVTIEYVGLPDQPAAMANGKVDVILVTEPQASLSEARGFGKIAVTLDDLLPGFQSALMYYNRDWARRDPESARRWMVAYVKGLRYYNHALQNQQVRDDVIAILSAHTALKDRAVWNRMIWPGLDPDGAVGIRSLLEYERWLLNEHQISAFVLPDRLVDLSYIRDASTILGPYHP